MEKKEENLSEEDIKSHNFRRFVVKEIFDKVGYGFGSQQFVNILFYLTGASIFLVGLVNGLKALLSLVFEVFIHEYNRLNKISRKVIGFSGIFFGFSFLFMAIGKFVKSPLVFAISFILGGMSIMIYGNFSQDFFVIGRKKHILHTLVKYGLIVTAISLFLGAFIIDSYPEHTRMSFNISGKTYDLRMPGYLIAFEIAAIAFIISGYFLATVKDVEESPKQQAQYKDVFSNIRAKSKKALGNKFMYFLMFSSIAVSIVQVIGNSYYGIFIYENYRHSYFGGFLNIAVVFLIGVFSSLIGYLLTKINTKSYGPVPILTGGVLLLSAMPFLYSFGRDLTWLTTGTIFGVLGASAFGIASSMLLLRELDDDERKNFHTISGLYSIAPYIIVIPLLAYFAQNSGLNHVFTILGSILVAVAVLIPVSYLSTKNKPSSKTKLAMKQ